MGLIGQIFGLVFGGGRNVIRETAEVFRENAEAGAERGQAVQLQAMQQYGKEFSVPRQGWFDRFMDGLNRLPCPAMALGTLGLIVSAMADPIWFSTRMQGIALVPEPAQCPHGTHLTTHPPHCTRVLTLVPEHVPTALALHPTVLVCSV